MTMYQFIDTYADPPTTLNGDIALSDPVSLNVHALPPGITPGGDPFAIYVVDPLADTNGEVMLVTDVTVGGPPYLLWTASRLFGLSNPGAVVDHVDGSRIYLPTTAQMLLALRDWPNLTNKPAEFPPTDHGHTVSGDGGPVSFLDLASIPSAFPPSGHHASHEAPLGSDIVAVTEAMLGFTDLTTMNASAARHGLLPKLSGVSTDALKGDGSWGTVAGGGGGSLPEDYILLQDQKASGVGSGTFTSGAWQTRVLTTEVFDTGNNCTLASNQFVLTAGTYRILAFGPSFNVHENQLRLQNITDSTTVLTGENTYSGASGGTSSTAVLQGRFTLTATKTLELQHRCASTVASNGLGVTTGWGTEVYASVELWKEVSQSSFLGLTKLTPPPSTGWTWDNQGTSTISTVTTDFGSTVQDLYAPKKGATQLAIRYRTAPATPYTVTFCLLHDISGIPPGVSGTGLAAGYCVGFRDAGGKAIAFLFLNESTTSTGYDVVTDKWTSAAVFSADYTKYGPAPTVIDPVVRNPAWLQISDDGTNLIYRWSLTGIAGTWRQFDSRARGDFLATGPTGYFFGAYPNGCAVNVVLLSLQET